MSAPAPNHPSIEALLDYWLDAAMRPRPRRSTST
jgi:hypothetical protein